MSSDSYNNSSARNGVEVINDTIVMKNDETSRVQILDSTVKTNGRYITIENTLGSEIEVNMKAIMAYARKYCIVNEEWIKWDNESKILQEKADNHGKQIVTDTWRKKNKCKNITREIKNYEQSVSLIEAELKRKKYEIDDMRTNRLILLTANQKAEVMTDTKTLSNKGTSNVVNKSRNVVHELLTGYKNDMNKSVGLRRAIIHEMTVADLGSTKGQRKNPINVNDFLKSMEKWEIHARELLKHRIKLAIQRNRGKTICIGNYVQRIGEFDKAFTYIRQRESISDIDDIV